MKVDFQKPVLPSSYKFQPVHLQWTGIHVAAGAMFSHSVASRLPDGKGATDLCAVSIVGLIVLVVYNIFALLKPSVKASEQHAFFQNHRIVITKVMAACLLTAAALSYFVSPALRNPGLLTCIISALCLWGYAKIPAKSPVNALKEPITAAIFMAGIWGSTWFFNDAKNDNIFLGAVFFLLSFQTLLVMAHFEATNRTGTQNLARWFGKILTRKITYLTGGLICIGCIYICFYTEFRFVQRVAVIFMLMGIAQVIIFLKSGQTESAKLLRTLPEFVGLLPLLLL